MQIIKLVLLFLISTTIISPLIAQETSTEADPYADYSYLWEENNKKKEKKKNKNKESTTSTTVAVSAADTIPDNSPAPQTVDSTQRVSQEAPQVVDTTQQVVQEAPLEVVDSTQVDTQPTGPSEAELLAAQQAQIQQDSIKQVDKQLKKEERAAKTAEKKDAKDFRAGRPPLNTSSSLNAGFTYSRINGQDYVGLVLAPELKFGKVGVGLDVPILYGLDDNSIRTEMFTDGAGFLRIIRYVRYGQQKVDPVYVKVGVLSGTMIGYGGLVNNYSNSTSYEKRKTGLHYDVNFLHGMVGIEGMYSDFDLSSLNLFVMRPYARPLKWLPTPIVRTLEVGITFLKDKDQTIRVVPPGSRDTYRFTEEGIGAFGLDAGMTLLSVPFIQIDLFANYSKLNVSTQALRDSLDAQSALDPTIIAGNDFKDGTGASIGLNFRFNFIADLLSTDIRIERLNYSESFVPQFFDASYELHKDLRILFLADKVQMKGIYGQLTGHILQKMRLGGSLMIPDQISESAPAVVTLFARADKIANKISINAQYFKGGLTDLSDAFTLDQRSLLKVRFSYHLNKFLVTGMDYFWSWTPTENGFQKTQYASPFFGLNIQF